MAQYLADREASFQLEADTYKVPSYGARLIFHYLEAKQLDFTGTRVPLSGTWYYTGAHVTNKAGDKLSIQTDPMVCGSSFAETYFFNTRETTRYETPDDLYRFIDEWAKHW